MIDREARDKLAGLLESALNGTITAELIGIDDKERRTRDAAQNGILSYLLPLSDRWLSESDCSDWSNCVDECRSCSRFGRRSEERRNCQTKRAVAHAVSFLRTDQEYEWDGIRLTWWMVPLVFLALLIGVSLCMMIGLQALDGLKRLGFSIRPGPVLFCVCFPLAILFLVFCEKLSPMSRKRDRRYWPFASRERCEAARAGDR